MIQPSLVSDTVLGQLFEKITHEQIAQPKYHTHDRTTQQGVLTMSPTSTEQTVSPLSRPTTFASSVSPARSHQEPPMFSVSEAVVAVVADQEGSL